MSKRFSLRLIIPLGIIAVFIIVSVLALIFTLFEQRQVVFQQARDDMSRDVAHFSRLAERVLYTDPQILEDDISQRATDPRLQAIAVISPLGEVIYASEFAWREQLAVDVIDSFPLALFSQVIAHRHSEVRYDAESQKMLALMSYVSPSQDSTVRSLDKGAIYLVYDLSMVLEQVRTDALVQRLPDLLTMLLVSILIGMFLRHYVSVPLTRIEAGAKAIESGNYGIEIEPSGAQETYVLTSTFNRMSSQLADTISELDIKSSHTQAILNNVVDGIVTIDEKGIVNSFNAAAEEIFGYSSKEVMGKNVKCLMPEPYRAEHDGYLESYLSTGVARIIGIGREVEGQRQNGEVFPMELAVSEIQQQGRSVFIGVVRDITERKRVDQMKSEFVSTVSHELRTPLTSIAGSLSLLAGGVLGEVPAQAKQLLDIAQNNSQRLTLLINDLLDMEKIAAGKMHFEIQPHSLVFLVEQALEQNHGLTEQYDVQFELESPMTGDVRVDSQRLIQVLTNFLSNAAKFSPDESQVEVKIKRLDGYLRVEVHDHGPGIPEAFHDRIFQKFSQADSSDTRQKGGTGLGLAISKELIERMGGRIGFESKEGEGACFYFDLPDTETLSEHDPLVKVPAHAPRILVVEDDKEIAHMLARMLQRGGYQVDVAYTGAETLQRLGQQSYAAMTLDLMLPDMSGLEIIRRVRHQASTMHLPVVVVSAKMEEGRLAINGDFAAIEWLPKPFAEKHLLHSVDKLLPEVSGSKPRVLHVEDDNDLHTVVKAMVNGRYEFEQATSVAQAREYLKLEQFDVVILDITLPDGTGWDLLPELHALEPVPRVIILSGKELSKTETDKVEQALLKSQVSPQALLQALNSHIEAQAVVVEP